MRKLFGTLLKWVLALVSVIFAGACVLVYLLVFYEMPDDDLFSIADRALNEDCVGIQRDVDNILGDEQNFDTSIRMNDDGEENSDEVWGLVKGFAKGSNLGRFSSRLLNAEGVYSLCRINSKRCIRIRYGWPNNLADVVMYHSNDQVEMKPHQRRLNQHVIIFRAFRHD